MDRIITGNEGFMPFLQKDIDFMQDAYEAAINGLASAYGDNVILSGCERSPENNIEIRLSAGWVLIGGELCRVEEQVIETGPDYDRPLYYDVVVSEEEEREFKTEVAGVQNHKVWQRKRAVPSVDSGSGVALRKLYEKKNQLDTLRRDTIVNLTIVRNGFLVIVTGMLTVGTEDEYTDYADLCELPFAARHDVYGAVNSDTDTETGLAAGLRIEEGSTTLQAYLKRGWEYPVNFSYFTY